MSVNDILDKIKVWDNQDKITDVETNEIPVQEQAPAIITPADSQPEEETLPVTVEPAPEVKIADIYSTRIKVDSTEEAVDKSSRSSGQQADYDCNGQHMRQALSRQHQMVENQADAEKVEVL